VDEGAGSALSGNHQEIRRFRKESALEKTARLRPICWRSREGKDLLPGFSGFLREQNPARQYKIED